MIVSTSHWHMLMWIDVEYSASGKVIKGRERAKARSKYEEDGESTFYRE